MDVFSTDGKVFTDEEVKTFNFMTDVFILDDYGLLKRIYDYTDCNVRFNNPVKVFNDIGKLIGSAVLEKQANVVVADIYLDYATPERLNIETKSIPLYTHLDSFCYVNANNLPGRPAKASQMIVNGIILTSSPTTDDRIEAL